MQTINPIKEGSIMSKQSIPHRISVVVGSSPWRDVVIHFEVLNAVVTDQSIHNAIQISAGRLIAQIKDIPLLLNHTLPVALEERRVRKLLRNR